MQGKSEGIAQKGVSSLDETIQLAWKAIEYTHHELSLGSVNKRSDQDGPNFGIALTQINKLRQELDSNFEKHMQLAISANVNLDPFILRIQCLSAVYLSFKVGNCIEQSIVALNFLKDANVDDISWCCMEGGDHYFLIINGNVICDPWANDVYCITEFKEKKKASADFKYADFVYQVKPLVKPFLYGTPHTLFSTNKKPAVLNGDFVKLQETEQYQKMLVGN